MFCLINPEDQSVFSHMKWLENPDWSKSLCKCQEPLFNSREVGGEVFRSIGNIRKKICDFDFDRAPPVLNIHRCYRNSYEDSFPSLLKYEGDEYFVDSRPLVTLTDFQFVRFFQMIGETIILNTTIEDRRHISLSAYGYFYDFLHGLYHRKDAKSFNYICHCSGTIGYDHVINSRNSRICGKWLALKSSESLVMARLKFDVNHVFEIG